MKNSSLLHRKLAGISLLLAFMFIFVTSCNKDENVQPEQMEDFPDLITALESFDEEIVYYGAEDQAARRGPKSDKWKKKWIKRPTFFTLAAALKHTGLFIPVVQNRLTLFAPTDEAFHDAGITFWNVWGIDKEVLTNILLYHATEGFIFSNQLPECSLDMLNGSAIGLNFMDGKVLIKDASPEFAQVIATDKRALNSVFHIIDKVLTPPDQTIAEIAVGNSNFTILVKLLDAAGLVGVVNDPDQNLTVFAPVNAAFEALFPGKTEDEIVDALKADLDALTEILLHHVAGGSTFSFCLSDGQKIPTLNEDNLTVDLENLKIISSSENAVGLVGDLLDLHANNGVVHVIDGVLLPAPKP
jgi:uncharacterized surface protein with fasciclin (FAS1) repeats